jgi:Tol biopolymer transport system component
METGIGRRSARRRVGSKSKLFGGFLVAALAVAAAAAPAQATAPGRNGRIAYSHFGKSFRLARIRTVRPDGGGVKTLTHARKKVYDFNPDWAPNGSNVVFDRETDISCGSRCIPGIYTVRRDGSHLTRLTPNDPNIFSEDPAYSPDGTRIAFDRTVGPRPFNIGIFIMDANGTHVTQVTHEGPSDPYQEGEVQWSPNGGRLVFQRARRSDGAIAVYTAKADGTDFHRLTPWWLDASHPDWSPNGGRIVLEDYTEGPPPGRSANVFTVRPDGSHLKKVTHNTGGTVQSNNPAWSPNGKALVFAKWRGCPDCVSDVFRMRANGTHIRQVTTSPVWDFRPDWGARR